MGTRSLSGTKIALKMTSTVQNTLTDGTVSSVAHPTWSYSQSLSDGVEDKQANRAWQSEDRALGSGASEVLDLYDMGGVDIGGGAGLDGLGQAVSPFEEIVAIAIVCESLSTAAGRLEIIPDSTNGWAPIGSHTVANGGALAGGGVLFKCQVTENAFAITDASSHRINIKANGGALSYSIYILARHDAETSSSSSSLSSSSSSQSSSSSSFSSSSSQSSSSSSQSSLSSNSSSSSSSSSLSSQSESSMSESSASGI